MSALPIPQPGSPVSETQQQEPLTYDEAITTLHRPESVLVVAAEHAKQAVLEHFKEKLPEMDEEAREAVMGFISEVCEYISSQVPVPAEDKALRNLRQDLEKVNDLTTEATAATIQINEAEGMSVGDASHARGSLGASFIGTRYLENWLSPSGDLHYQVIAEGYVGGRSRDIDSMTAATVNRMRAKITNMDNRLRAHYREKYPYELKYKDRHIRMILQQLAGARIRDLVAQIYIPMIGERHGHLSKLSKELQSRPYTIIDSGTEDHPTLSAFGQISDHRDIKVVAYSKGPTIPYATETIYYYGKKEETEAYDDELEDEWQEPAEPEEPQPPQEIARKFTVNGQVYVLAVDGNPVEDAYPVTVLEPANIVEAWKQLTKGMAQVPAS